MAQKNEIFKKWYFWVIIVLGIAVIGNLNQNKDDTKENDIAQNESVSFDQVGYYKNEENYLRYKTFYINTSITIDRNNISDELLLLIEEHGSKQMHTDDAVTASFYYINKEDVPDITLMTAQQSNDIAHENNPLVTVWIMPNNDVNVFINPLSEEQTEKMTDEQELNYIKGIYASDIYLSLEERGFKTERKQMTSYDDKIIQYWICSYETSAYKYEVYIYGYAPEKIYNIESTVIKYYQDQDIISLANDFLGFMATTPYEESNPEEAKEWIQDNISKNNTITINGVTFEMFGETNPNARILEIRIDK